MLKALHASINLNYLIISLCSLLLVACGGGGSSSPNTSTAVNLESLSVDGPSTKLKSGTTFQLSVAALYSDNSNEDISSEVAWQSANETILSISDTGLVSALSAGIIQVSATYLEQTASATIEVIDLNSIEISGIPTSLTIGTSTQLAASATYSDTSSEELTNTVTWSSSNNSVATISSGGILSIIGAGNSTISIEHGALNDQQSIAVVVIEGFSLSTLPSSMEAGETQQLSSTANYSNSTIIDTSSLATWSSSNESILSVSNSGLVTAVSAGNATITASFGGLQGTSSTEVYALQSLSVSDLPAALEAGETQQLSSTANYSNSSTIDASSLATWSSSNESILSVSNSGLVTAVSAGNATITASFGGLQGTSSTEVYALQNLSISDLSATIEVGETRQLSSAANYSNSTIIDASSLATWSSSNESILSVSNSGLVTAVSAGNATITATFEGIQGTADTEVFSLSSISITPGSVTLAIDSSQNLTATGLYTHDSTSDLSSAVTWQSSNDAIASVSDTGLVHAVSAGDVTITASLDSLSTSIITSVSPATLQSISLDIPDTLIAGLSTELSATGTYSDGSTQDITRELSWLSNDQALATIDGESYTINALQAGSVLIAAGKGSLNAQTTLTISPAQLSSIVATPSVLTLAKGTDSEVNVTAIFTDQSHLDITSQVSWTSNDDNIGSATQGSASISALAVGNVSITAQLGEQVTTIQLSVTDAELLEITILPINAFTPKGLTESFSAQGRYTDDSVQNIGHLVSWISSDNNVASLSNAENSQGLASALTPGQTDITASLGDISVSTSLTVQDALLNAIEVQPGNASIPNGVHISTTAIGSYSDGSQRDLSNEVSWNTSNNQVAQVNSLASPLIETYAEGETLISAELQGVSGFSLINVTTASLQSISINSTSTTLAKGFTEQLSAIGLYSDTSSQDISHLVTWESTDNSILTVDNDDASEGLLRAVSQGSSTVSAKLEDKEGLLLFEVTDAMLSSIEISSSSSTLIVNSEAQFTATGSYSDNSSKDITQDVNWSSSTNDVASIDSAGNSGLVNALAVGSTNIDASLLNSAGVNISSNLISLNIAQNPNTPKSLSLTLSPNVIFNDDSDSSVVSANLSPNSSDGTIADGTSVTFTIVENGVTRTETAFTFNGNAQINVSSTQKGLISITASSDNNVESTGGIFSTDEFSDVIATQAQAKAQASYDSASGTLLKGSILLTFVRNISNRDFNLSQIQVRSGSGSFNDSTHLPDSPFSAPELTSDNELAGDEFMAFGYILDDDVIDSTFYIAYLFSDSATSSSFVVGAGFPFN